MLNSPSPETCATCGSDLPLRALYCRDCGAMNRSAPALRPPVASQNTATPADQRPLLTPRTSATTSRPSAVPAAPVRRPRWILGTFWALWAVLFFIAGVAGPAKWLILVSIALGAYSVYLYRGGRYGWFFI